MLSPDAIRQGQHVLTVCNACRYCEAFCPVFPAVENRLSFAKGDLAYLANLCHNCGECLYACQYAPPHEFGINVPRALAEIRLGSYEEHCWPAVLSVAFKSQRLTRVMALVGSSTVVLLALTLALGGDIWPADPRGDFYQVLPHGVMVAIFGVLGLWTLVGLGAGVVRFWRATPRSPATPPPNSGILLPALHDVLTLRHLHATGVDCSDRLERRSSLRRTFHHLTFYGFLLCFASTSVAALYDIAFDWRAPYGYLSLPVVLGTLGGAGLVVGSAGLFVRRLLRDRDLMDAAQYSLDDSFIVMLFMTSATGLLLLVFRNESVMTVVFVAHLGFVAGLFLTMPYGKFVHGLYRTAALVKYAMEARQ